MAEAYGNKGGWIYGNDYIQAWCTASVLNETSTEITYRVEGQLCLTNAYQYGAQLDLGYCNSVSPESRTITQTYYESWDNIDNNWRPKSCAHSDITFLKNEERKITVFVFAHGATVNGYNPYPGESEARLELRIPSKQVMLSDNITNIKSAVRKAEIPLPTSPQIMINVPDGKKILQVHVKDPWVRKKFYMYSPNGVFQDINTVLRIPSSAMTLQEINDTFKDENYYMRYSYLIKELNDKYYYPIDDFVIQKDNSTSFAMITVVLKGRSQPIINVRGWLFRSLEDLKNQQNPLVMSDKLSDNVCYIAATQII